MKTKNFYAIAVAVMALLVSCNKESFTQNESPIQNGPFEVTISGEMGEFAPTTKSTAESCIRVKWSAGDIVWAYDKSGTGLGGLTVSIGEGDYIAIMTGTLSSAPSDGKLFLVHSPLLSKDTQPSYSSGVTVDMKTQSADITPFVAYAVVKGVTATAQSNLKTKFSFATSVLKVNATGITKGATLTSASISDIETACKLTINSSTGAFEVAGETSGTITKTLSGTASLSRASFYVAVPTFSAGAQRVLTVTAGSTDYLEHKVMQTAYAANNYINYVYEVKTLDYTDEYGVSRGNGTYIANTGVVWAPVNCGYEPATTSPEYKGYPYGKLYQWGRKYGQGYGTTYDATAPTIAEYWTGTNGKEDSNTFYKYHNLTTDGSTHNRDWIQNGSNTYWNAGTDSAPAKTNYDPCPVGWRVPTYAELYALTGNQNPGRNGWDNTNNGYWFNGTTNPQLNQGLFLPAAGYRTYDNGAADGRGSLGHYWSSSVGESYAWYFSFGNNFAEKYCVERALGHSIRCVQE